MKEYKSQGTIIPQALTGLLGYILGSNARLSVDQSKDDCVSIGGITIVSNALSKIIDAIQNMDVDRRSYLYSKLAFCEYLAWVALRQPPLGRGYLHEAQLKIINNVLKMGVKFPISGQFLYIKSNGSLIAAAELQKTLAKSVRFHVTQSHPSTYKGRFYMTSHIRRVFDLAEEAEPGSEVALPDYTMGGRINMRSGSANVYNLSLHEPFLSDEDAILTSIHDSDELDYGHIISIIAQLQNRFMLSLPPALRDMIDDDDFVFKMLISQAGADQRFGFMYMTSLVDDDELIKKLRDAYN